MGIEKIDYQRCNGCLQCWDTCPMDVIRVLGKTVYLAYPEDCMCCYLCELACPNDAIYVSPKRTKSKPLPW
ncbi:hypothetical protein SY88_16570 [Clostridiales bacterium PH28_bin88]|nr:hypothetical protein SY88_16570 [Clostridiales bacterium PH28_bin88]